MSHNGLGRVLLCRSHYSDLLKPDTAKPVISRCFSRTAQRSKAIPTFSPCSTPELDALFSEYRAKVFTPAALRPEHRSLIYKPSRHSILLKDPGVTVTMSDDEEINLVPMNMHERPNKKVSLQRLLKLLQDGRDWQNLPAFLKGMHISGQKVSDGYMERFVRRANEQGKEGVILRCAEMVEKTGLSLAEPEVTLELMLGTHLRAVEAGFKGEAMDKALRQAQQVALLLERPEHCGGKTLKKGQVDMRKDVGVLGIILELTAAAEQQFDFSRTETEPQRDITSANVTKSAWKLITAWPQLDLTVDQIPGRAGKQLEAWLPIWFGIKLALNSSTLKQPRQPQLNQKENKVDNDNDSDDDHLHQTNLLRHELSRALPPLNKSIELAREKVAAAAGDSSRRCLRMYDDLKDLDRV